MREKNISRLPISCLRLAIQEIAKEQKHACGCDAKPESKPGKARPQQISKDRNGYHKFARAVGIPCRGLDPSRC